MRLGGGSVSMASDGHHGVSVLNVWRFGLIDEVDGWFDEGQGVHERKLDAYIGTIPKFDERPPRNVCIFNILEFVCVFEIVW